MKWRKVQHKGKLRVVTGITTVDTVEQSPRHDQDRVQMDKRGPLFLIIYTTAKFEDAKEKRRQLRKQYGGRCRVKLVPSKAEFEAIARGNFEVEEEVDDVEGDD